MNTKKNGKTPFVRYIKKIHEWGFTFYESYHRIIKEIIKRTGDISWFHKFNTYVFDGIEPDLHSELERECWDKLKTDLIKHHYRLAEYSVNWKGGVTDENHKIRQSKEYREWRRKVFERDSFTCHCCGQEGGKLNAHHIAHFSKNKELRTDVNNGITLCEKCHKAIHKLEGR